MNPFISRLALISLVAAPCFAQNAITWQVNRAVMAGSGCSKDVNAFITTNGNDVSIVFTQFGIEMPGAAHRPLADRKNCNINIPASIPRGAYVADLTQRLIYGITKSANSQSNLMVQSSFFGMNMNSHGMDFRQGQVVNEALKVQSRVDHYDSTRTPDWHRGFCDQNRDQQGRFESHMTVTGQRKTDSDTLIMFVDGLDLKFELVTAVAACPTNPGRPGGPPGPGEHGGAGGPGGPGHR